jgi:preprotein translocase subunit YajC
MGIGYIIFVGCVIVMWFYMGRKDEDLQRQIDDLKRELEEMKGKGTLATDNTERHG